MGYVIRAETCDGGYLSYPAFEDEGQDTSQLKWEHDSVVLVVEACSYLLIFG
jgi:hypothetical protein